MVSASAYHACAVTTTGSVQCWGLNAYGQLGDGTTTQQNTPVTVAGLGATATAVAAAENHSCALLSNGTVKCWGINSAGQLGNGNTTNSLTPVTVLGLASVVSISTGWFHTCAVLSGGGLKCWGSNGYGQLGDGTQTNRSSPVDVLGGLTSGVANVAGGYLHTCATLTSGALKCWGTNNYGQVGDNSVAGTVRTTPVDVAGLSSGVSKTSLGAYSSCALLTSGGVKCWGYGGSGNIGDAAYTNRPTPVDVIGLQSGVATLAHGRYHVCVSLSSGSVRCWGSNGTGELGSNSISGANQPIDVVGLAGGIASVAAGSGSSCALVAASGGITCWGWNAFGQLGDGSGTVALSPVDVAGLASGVGSLSAGYEHACAVSTVGAVQCWGRNFWGQLGDGTQTDRWTPTPVVGLATGIVALAVGQQHTCALTNTGAVKCWGYNGSGALGDGTTTLRLTPVDTVGLSSGVVAISAYGNHTCALVTGGAMKCWGYNADGQLGDNSTTSRSVPTDVTGLGSGITSISAGNSTSCAVENGAAFCWGRNDSGQLGTGNTTGVLVPTSVSGLTSGVAKVITGYLHTCGMTLTGASYCWGNNNWANIGDGSYSNRALPTPVSGLSGGTAEIAPGGDFTCAVDSSSSAKCWGYTFYGELGVGYSILSNLTVPTLVPTLSGITASVTAGYQFACARTTAGGAKCWGNNGYGQLGNGTSSTRKLPLSSVVGFPANLTTTTTISALPNPSMFGQGVGLTATIVGISPSGTANFKEGGSGISGCTNVTVTLGQATCSTSALTVGSHSLQVDYSGDLNNAASSSAVFNQVVTPLPATVSVASSANPSVAGQAVTFTASVGGNSPSGSVTFYDDAQVIAGCGMVALSGGNPATAVCGSISSLATRVHLITASYTGDVNNAANAAVLVQTVTQSAAASSPSVVTGSYHTCALSSGGVVKCWGDNEFYGQLGNGSGLKSAVPVAVLGLGAGVRALAAGSNHTCATTAPGGVMCWGDNSYGQLGDGSTSGRTIPVTVSGLSASVIALAAGSNHTCALLSTGAMQCWGNNSLGQLGTGSTSPSTHLSPVSVSALPAGIVTIAAGGSNTCALGAAGGVKCWGAARVGDGTTTSRSTPTDVLGLSSGVASISTGSGHSCALITGGAVQCWGGNGSGQLGDGTTAVRAVPTPVFGLGGTVLRVVAGPGTSCAILASGGLKCWGSGIYGKLGDGSNASINIAPAAVVGLASGVTSVAVGQSHVCALTQGGSIRCWGRNTEGQLGEGVFGLALSPTPVQTLSSGVATIIAGGFHACSTDAAGAMKCWGSRSQGAVGDGVISNISATTPVTVSGLAGAVAQMAAGLSHTCTRTIANALQCWGGNSQYGQLGDGTTTNRAVPGSVSGLATVISVAGGYSHTCAVTPAGGVKCWGSNTSGQLGNGTTSFSAQSTPVDVTGLSSGVSAVSAGGNNSCSLSTTGGVKCWGDNYGGQLGDGSTTSRSLPADVSGLTSGVTAVAVGGASCALMTGGAIQCWGDNSYGAVGDGTNINRSTPVTVSGLGGPATAIGVSGSHTCALMATGGVKCWGANYAGQLGDGSIVSRNTPADVPGLTSGVVAIAVGTQFNCALLSTGAVKCWGDNQAGQIGDGTVGYRTTATGYVLQPSLTQPLAVADGPTVTASVDGALIARYLSGMTGSAVTSGLTTSGALRTDPAQVGAYLDTIRPLLDIDGDGQFIPLTDGLLLIRYMSGVRGDALITGVVGAGASRSTVVAIEAYLATLLP
ncbi:MAG: Ig-like domain repeat protein [Casimicrobium sp.]